MPELNTLLERRATAWEGYQEILERARSADELSSEDQEALTRAESDLSALTSQIDVLNRAAELERNLATPTEPTGRAAGSGESEERDAAYTEAFSAYLRRGLDAMPEEQRSVIREGFEQWSDELRAQAVGTNSAGGFLVAPEFRRKLQETLKFFSSMRQVAEVITTDTGAQLPWPTNDDTGNKGARLAENTQVTEQDMTFGQKTIDAYMYTSRLVRVSFQLLQDSAFDLELWLPQKLGERIGRIQEEEFTVADGDSKPTGAAHATAGFGVGATGPEGTDESVIWESLIDVQHSIDPAYRNERARWMLHDLSVAKIRKLKDGDDRPLWEPSTKVGTPDTLLGSPISINNEMPQMAEGAKSILYGDFHAGYLVRDVTGVQVLRLTERYADFLQVGFLAFQRSDGEIQDTNAVKAYVNGEPVDEG